MAFPRRYLPSMSLLCAFEAAARNQSFTAAAAEVNLTQSAVSRQIKALEEIVGCELFIRERQTIRLSAGGEAYLRAIQPALQAISAATVGMKTNPSGGELTLAILPTFGTRWLAPRLADFYARHPGITINLMTRLAPFDFQMDSCDAAIHFGEPDWIGAELDFLMHENVAPVCSPELKHNYNLRMPKDLLHVPLINVISRPDAWTSWLSANDVGQLNVDGMTVDQFGTAAQAAASGLGVALLPEFLIEAEIKSGELVPACTQATSPAGKYYLAWPKWKGRMNPLKVFREWIKEQAAQ